MKLLIVERFLRTAIDHLFDTDSKTVVKMENCEVQNMKNQNMKSGSESSNNNEDGTEDIDDRPDVANYELFDGEDLEDDEDSSSETNTVKFSPLAEDFPNSAISGDLSPDMADVQTLKDQITSDLYALNPITRKKIASLQHCKTFSFVDSSEERFNDKSMKNNHSYTDAQQTEDTIVPLKPCLALTSKNLRKSRSISESSQPPPPVQSLEMLSPASPNIIIPRSVSFNDRLLGGKEPPVQQREVRSVSSENFKKVEDKATSPPIRRQASTPGRLEKGDKVDAACGSARNSSRTSSGRKVIKNFTSSLRKFSLKSSSKDKKFRKSLNSDVANGLPSAETSGIVSYEALLRLFECPGCDEFMAPPFVQCKKGHLVCSKCRTTCKGTCPSCKQRIVDHNNYMMTQVYQLVRFPCQFFPYGCLEYHAPSQKNDHEHFCHYRPINCHFESKGCEAYLALKDMQLHIQQCQFKSSG